MGNIEIYKKWRPLPVLNEKMLVDRLEDTDEGLSIILKFISSSLLKEKRVKVLFDSYVAYRNMDESYRAKTFSDIGGFKSSFYLVEGSNWLKWLHIESLNIYKNIEIKHYLIVTEADCIDILSEFDPIIDFR